MLKLENSIRGLSFSRVAFDLTIQGIKNSPYKFFIPINLFHLSKKEVFPSIDGTLPLSVLYSNTILL